MHHLYLSYQPSETSLRKERESLEGWCVEKGIQEYAVIEEKLTVGRISQRQLIKLLKPVLPGDIVVVPSQKRLGRSVNMLLSVLRILHGKGVTVITIDDNKTYLPDEATLAYITALESFVTLASGIKAERSNEALDKAKADGKHIGRPSGKKKDPAKNVLVGKTEKLVILYYNGFKPQKIADELGVSRTTVTNYIKANNLSRNTGV